MQNIEKKAYLEPLTQNNWGFHSPIWRVRPGSVEVRGLAMIRNFARFFLTHGKFPMGHVFTQICPAKKAGEFTIFVSFVEAPEGVIVPEGNDKPVFALDDFPADGYRDQDYKDVIRRFGLEHGKPAN